MPMKLKDIHRFPSSLIGRGGHIAMSETGQCSSAPQFVLTAEGEIYGEDTPENREIVRRIHACVNACEGISTDELEKGIVGDMRRVIAGVVPLLSAAGSDSANAVRNSPAIAAQRSGEARSIPA
jgi:hypothetical protein